MNSEGVEGYSLLKGQGNGSSGGNQKPQMNSEGVVPQE